MNASPTQDPDAPARDHRGGIDDNGGGGGGGGNDSNNPLAQRRASPKKDARNSPVVPLAPLEYLQNQRRGSITDPSLHAAAPNLHMNAISKLNHSNASAFRPPELNSTTTFTSRDNQSKLPEPRPASPYVFGDATPQANDLTTIRRLLHSPSPERDDGEAPSSKKSFNPSRTLPGPLRSGSGDQLKSDNRHLFDHTMRRHSIAVGQGHFNQSSSSSSSQGTKRKISPTRAAFLAGEEIDPQLIGPGVPSGAADADAPPPKRRGSTVDTQRIAQLSLHDQRRHSVDSRAVGGGEPWWQNSDRREPPAALMFPVGQTVGGYAPPGFPADSAAHGRSSSAFAWTTSPQPADQPMHDEAAPNLQASQRTFDSPVAMIQPMAFPQERRMSLQENAPTPGTAGPTRVLRSRSRPPSRQLRSSEISSTSQAAPSLSSADAQDNVVSSAPSPSSKTPKDAGSTPYSRSPELRVSHKLAERKRRKEMKDLFDELRDQLPADRGMKASKWEILSKAIDFVAGLKQTHQEMAREIEMLRHELDTIRQGGIPPFTPGGPPHAVMYGPPTVPGQYPPPPPPLQPQSGTVPHPSQPTHHPPQISRPSSSQNMYPPEVSLQNGNTNRNEGPP